MRRASDLWCGSAIQTMQLATNTRIVATRIGSQSAGIVTIAHLQLARAGQASRLDWMRGVYSSSRAPATGRQG